MELGNPVKVFELLPVKDDEVAARHLGHVVNRKAGGLVKRDTQVQ
jgi:hypothetical protein